MKKVIIVAGILALTGMSVEARAAVMADPILCPVKGAYVFSDSPSCGCSAVCASTGGLILPTVMLNSTCHDSKAVCDSICIDACKETHGNAIVDPDLEWNTAPGGPLLF